MNDDKNTDRHHLRLVLDAVDAYLQSQTDDEQKQAEFDLYNKTENALVYLEDTNSQ